MNPASNTETLVDARGRKYLTREERERFLAAVRAHPKPTVQTLARARAHRLSRERSPRDPRLRYRPRRGRDPVRHAQTPQRALESRSRPRGSLVHDRARAPRTARSGDPSRANGATVGRTSPAKPPTARCARSCTPPASPPCRPASHSPQSPPCSGTPTCRQQRSTPP